MSSKNLINLGLAPDSGTGDSARRGGEKINTLFTDIYSQFGDNPVGNDPSQPFYGYRRPFFEYEYRVGELHPAGRFIPITFNNPVSALSFDPTHGHGMDNAGNVVDSNTNGVPDIYEDSEWYFLSRGESVTLDLGDLTTGSTINLVLPLAVTGDIIKVRDSFSTWSTHNINVWTTPYEFTADAQVVEWEAAMGTTYPDSDSISISGESASYKSVTSHNVGSYPNLSVSYRGSAAGASKVSYGSLGDVELIFTYMGPRRGWIVRRQDLEAGDIDTRLSGIDSEIAYLKLNLIEFKNQSDSEDLVIKADHDSDTLIINNKINNLDSDLSTLIAAIDGGTF